MKIAKKCYRGGARTFVTGLIFCAVISSTHAESSPAPDPEGISESQQEHQPFSPKERLPFGPPSVLPDGETRGVSPPGPNINVPRPGPLSREERMAHARAGHEALRRPEIADPQSAHNREIRNELMQRRAARIAKEEERGVLIQKGRFEKPRDPRMVPLRNEAEDLSRESPLPEEAEDQGTIREEDDD